MIGFISASDEAAIDAALVRDPRDLAAMLAKGEARTRAGDDRGAASFYTAALRQAGAAGPLPAALEPAIRRAQAALAQASGRFEAHLEASLVAAGYPPGKRSERFQHSLDILAGRRGATLELQQPTNYLFPGLPQRRYYERSEFPWLAAVEAETAAMREELSALISDGDAFRPYMVDGLDRPRRDFHGLVDNPDWSTLHLYENGAPVADIVARAPRTWAALTGVPMPYIGARAPSVLFSMLRAGACIPPHTGMLNARLICHLPLIVPPGCGFRVGGETRQWEVGKAIIFDDSVVHEAWNDGPEDRVVLIFDIWRPELSAEEGAAVTAMFAAIDSYGAVA